MKVLQIITSAYRATAEEQDDTVVWITHAMINAGAGLSVLLSGNAVNYLAPEQDASGLCIGTWRQTQPPRVASDVAGIAAKGATVYCVAEDLEDRGLHGRVQLQEARIVRRAQLPALFEEFDQVWRW